MNQNVADVMSAVSELSGPEWAELQTLLHEEGKRRRMAGVLSFHPGQKVEFTHKGATYKGRVKKTNRQTVSVTVSMKDSYPIRGEWRVAPSLLEAVA